MRKKYLSALLFGALLVTSAGTFTSCKDYDDDINNLQEQITDVKNAVAELQKSIGDGKFLTNIVAENNGLKITWNDGSSTVIENVINGEAQKGDVVSIDAETGEIKINDEGTGFYASKNPETEKFKAPYVNADGVLVLINEEGEEVVTDIRTAPVTAIENTDGTTTLVIWADGVRQEVLIPAAANMLSEVEFLGYKGDISGETAGGNGFISVEDGYVNYSVYRISSENAQKMAKDWKGNKPALKTDDITAAYTTYDLITRVSPTQVDAKTLDFTMVDSKGNEAPVNVKLSNYNEKLTTASRAASQNGLYKVDFDCVVFNSPLSNGNAFGDIYGDGTANRSLFAMKSSTGLTSKFDVVFERDDVSITIVNNDIKLTDGNVVYGNNDQIETNKNYTVFFKDKDQYIYDAYLEFKEDEALYWGVKYDKKNAPMDFSVTKMPDSQTPAPLTITVHFVTLDGTIKKEVITVKPTTNMNGVQLCDLIKHNIVQNTAAKPNNNAQVVSLDKMVETLGTEGYITWKADVDLSETKTSGVAIVTNDGKFTPIADSYTVEFLKADGNTTTDASEAKSLRVTFQNAKAIDLTKQYIAVVEFMATDATKYYGGVVNTVNFPIEFSIPAFTDLLQKDMNVFDAEGEVASAYLLEGYSQGSGRMLAQYRLQGAFLNFKANVDKGFNFTMTLANDDKVVGNTPSSSLAHLTPDAINQTAWDATEAITSDNANKVTLTLSGGTTNGTPNQDLAYGKELTIKVTSAKYCGVYNYDDTSFKIKLLSPIKEGKFVANGGSIKIAHTGDTEITAEDVWATTVNDNVKYELFKTAVKDPTTGKFSMGWSRSDLKSVVFSTDETKFVVKGDGTPSAGEVDATTGNIKLQSSIILTASGNTGDTSKLKIAVTDIWGYTLEQEVDVVVE